MRWALVAAALLFFAIAALWLARDAERSQRAYPDGSSLGTGATGASLASAWFASRGVHVDRLEQPLALASLPRDALLIRLEPQPSRIWTPPEEMPDALDAGALDAGSGNAGAGDAGTDAGGATLLDAGPAREDGGSLLSVFTDDDGEDSEDESHGDAGRARDGGVRRLHLESSCAEQLRRFDPFRLDEADESFVRGGGALLIAAQGCMPARDGLLGDADAGSDDELDDEAGLISASKVLPIWPAAREVALRRGRALPPLALLDAQAIFEVDGHPVLARRALGAGELILMADAVPFENEHLAERDHLALLEAIAGARRSVLFDETVHGLQRERGLLDLLRGWGLSPALFLAALACALLFWRRAVTVGTPADSWRDQRSEALDFVDSAASLFERALLPADALLLYRAHAVREIALRLAVHPAEAERHLAALTGPLALPKPGAPMTARDLQQQLQPLTQALQRFRDEHPRIGDA